MTVNIDIKAVKNSDGSLNYLTYKYKGAVVKIGLGYDSDGNLNKLLVPAFLNLKHEQVYSLVMNQYLERINHIGDIAVIDLIKTINSIDDIKKVRGLNWYDRNPLSVFFDYGAAGVGPHVSTVRWTYQVPMGRMAYVESVCASIQRSGVAAAVGNARVFVYSADSAFVTAASTVNLVIFSNVVGDIKNQNVGQACLLQSGEYFAAETEDLSTGGTLDYVVGAKITEFDV